MDSKTEKLLKSLKSKKVGVFCDNANLYHAYQKYGFILTGLKKKWFLNKKAPSFYLGVALLVS